MPSFTGKTFSNFYKNILGIDQSTNTGVDATTRTVQDGAGNTTAISLSDDVLSVQPITDNTVGAMLVKNQGGSNILAVDTTNSKVLVGSSQTATNTQILQYSCQQMSPVAGSHMVLQAFPSTSYSAVATEEVLGTGANPSTSYDMSTGSDAQSWTNLLWRVPFNITIDSASVFFGTAAASTDTYNFHVISYAIDTDNGGTAGDLSDGVVVLDTGTQTADRTGVFYLGFTVQSADVDAGRVLMATLESDGTDSMSAALTVVYHIR